MLQAKACPCRFSSTLAWRPLCRLADRDLHCPGSPPPAPADWSVLVSVLSPVLLLLPPLPLLSQPLLLPPGRWEGTDEQWDGVVRKPSAPDISVSCDHVKTLHSLRFFSMPFSSQAQISLASVQKMMLREAIEPGRKIYACSPSRLPKAPFRWVCPLVSFPQQPW